MPFRRAGIGKIAFIRRWTMPSLQFLLFCLGIGFNVEAQYRLDHWTTNEGLPQNSVNAILQSRDGYLWLATNDGLVRFDGVRFTIFDRGHTPGIESNRFQALCQDRQGNLWAGTHEGFLTRYRDGTFNTYSTKDGLPNDDIFNLETDAEDHLWIIGTQIITQWRDGHAFTYHPRDCIPALSNSKGRRKIWWGLDKIGLHFFSRGRLFTFSERDGLPSRRINSVEDDQHGCLWIGTDDSGLIRVKDGQLMRYTVRDGLPANTIGATAFDDLRKDIWVGWRSSLLRIKDGAVLEYPDDGTVFYEDCEGTLWIGTGSKGLYRARKLPVSAITPKQGLYSERVYSILQDHHGNIWIGSWGGGLDKYLGDRFTHYLREDGLFSNNVTSLGEDGAGAVWVGTMGGLSRFKDGRLSRYSDHDGLSSVWAIQEDRQGNLWFGTTTGLTKLKDGNFTIYTTRDGLPFNHVEALLEDHTGALWIGTHDGLARFSNGQFTAYTERNGFAGHRVRALYEDREGMLWIGTYDAGLYRFRNGQFTAYTTKEGFYNNGVFWIQEDSLDYFWLSCNKGIHRVSRQQLNEFAEGKIRSISSTAYDMQDGLPNSECNGGRQPAGWRMRDGKFWFPTMGGVAIIDPEATMINLRPPPVEIEECRLDRDVVPFRTELQIPPGTVNLEIRYTGISFIKAEFIRFRYKLIGLDKDWVEPGSQRIAYYKQLPPGTYKFIVMAANSDGVWNRAGRSLMIVVAPPFWQTWWFRSLMILGAMGMMLSLYYRGRVRELQKENALQAAFSRQLIETQEHERERIARDLHDSLGADLSLIKGWAREELEQSDAASRRQERLEDIFTTTAQVLQAVKEIARDLRPQLLDSVGLKSAVESLLKRATRSSGVIFTSEIAPLDGVLTKETEIHLYRILQECISNIVEHSQATEAKVAIQKTNNSLLIKIQDNGRGEILPAPVSDRQRNRGFGLASIAERVRILGGEHTLHSLPGQGFTITISIRLNRQDGHYDD